MSTDAQLPLRQPPEHLRAGQALRLLAGVADGAVLNEYKLYHLDYHHCSRCQVLRVSSYVCKTPPRKLCVVIELFMIIWHLVTFIITTSDQAP